jgi:hypothetical protein
MGGYSQQMTFLLNNKVMIEVLGRTQEATYSLDTTSKPFQLEINLSHNNKDAIVPYIFEISEKKLHLCCPFLVQDLPTHFSGPGYVVMHQGRRGAETENLEIPTDENQAILFYLTRCNEIVSEQKISEKFPGESEEQAANRKILKILGLQNKLENFQKKFPAQIVEKVILLLSGIQTSEEEEISRSAKILREAMIATDLISEPKMKSGAAEEKPRAQGAAGNFKKIAAAVAVTAAVAAFVFLRFRRS